MEPGIPNYKLTQVIFQHRYDHGYRYFDVCGNTLFELVETCPDYVPEAMGPHTGILRHSFLPMAIAFGPADASLTLDGNPFVDSVENFKSDLCKLFPVIERNLKPTRTTRFGIRTYDIFATESVTAAVNYFKKSKFLSTNEEITVLLGKRSVGHGVTFKVEDESGGMRLALGTVKRTDASNITDQISIEDVKSAPQKPNHPSEKDFVAYLKKIRDLKESANFGVQIDIDFFATCPTIGFEEFVDAAFENRKNILSKLPQ